MKLAFLFILAASAWGAVTVQSSGIQATSKEIAFIADVGAADPSTCTVQASRVNDFSGSYAAVDDVDTTKFSGSNVLTRTSSIVSGSKVTFILGKDAAERGSDGYAYSRALKAATDHYIKVTCGGDTATFTASTKTVPFGLTRGEALPADPLNPGDYLHPSRKWNVSGQKIVDPETGVELSFPEAAGLRGVTSGSNLAFKSASGTNWTNPANALADDASSASITGNNTDYLFLQWHQDTASLGGTNWQAYTNGGVDFLQVSIKGSGTDATAANRAGKLYPTFNGVTPIGSGIPVTLPASEGTVTVGSGVPGDTLQPSGAKPYGQFRMARKSGQMTYVASTKVATFTSGTTSEDWSAGTKIRVSGVAVDVANVTAGNPPTVTTRTAHGFSTGNTVTISSVTGSIAASVNGTWTITVTDSTNFTLDGVNASGTYGTNYTICQKDGGVSGGTIKTVAGSPPRIHSPNSFISSLPRYATFSGFTSSGWTGLNTGTYQIIAVSGDSESYDISGATTTGAYDQTAGDSPDCFTPSSGSAATMKVLVGSVTSFVEYPISSVDSSTQVTLTSGPASDITVAQDWVVDGFGFLFKKDTTTGTVNIQYASGAYQRSAGTGWPAAGFSAFTEVTATGPSGKLGRIGYIGTLLTYLSNDGTVYSNYGKIYPHEELTLPGQGSICAGDPGNVDFNTGTIGINPNFPNRVYCLFFTSNQNYGFVVGDYVGDFRALDPTKLANSHYTNYAGYPVIANCNGYNGIEGVNSPVSLPDGTPCIKYYAPTASLKALMEPYGDQLWRKMNTSITGVPCNGGRSFGYNATAGRVEFSVRCDSGNDSPGVIYIFAVNDTNKTVSVVGEVATWNRTNARWSRTHGGTPVNSIKDGRLTWLPHANGMDEGGVINQYKAIYFADTGLLKGPFYFTYTSVNGNSSVDMAATGANGLQTCAPWAGNPLLPTPTPDGSTTTINGQLAGCTTITIDGEPYDTTLNATETAIVAADSATHLAKAGDSGRMWLQDVEVGDFLVHYEPSNNDFTNNEFMLVIAKTGSGPGATLVLYRGGGLKGFWYDNGSEEGAQSHTGETRRLVPWSSYDRVSGLYPYHYINYADFPTGQGGGELWIFAPSHGTQGKNVSMGSSGGQYAVMTGSYEVRRLKTGDDFTIPSVPAFSGKNPHSDSTLDTHLAYINGSCAGRNYFDCVFDARPWQGYAGVNGTLVAGTTGVYKWTAATQNAQSYTTLYPKYLPTAVRNQRRVMRSISGPGSSISDATPYTFCYALIAGECRGDSAAGDLYAVAPRVTTTGSVIQTSGQDKSADYDLSFGAVTSIMESFTQVAVAPIGNLATRMVTRGLGYYRQNHTFKNWTATPDGQNGVGVTIGLEDVKSEVWMAEIPPIRFDSWDRTKYIMWPITVPALAGANEAVIEFGYLRYGVAGSYYCMDRADACRAGGTATDTDPFMFAAETLRATSCISGCTIHVPVVGNKIMEWRVRYFNSGTPVATGTRQILATP